MRQVILIGGHKLLKNNTSVSAFCTQCNTQDHSNFKKLVNFFFLTLFSPFFHDLCSWQYFVDQQPYCFLLITHIH